VTEAFSEPMGRKRTPEKLNGSEGEKACALAEENRRKKQLADPETLSKTWNKNRLGLEKTTVFVARLVKVRPQGRIFPGEAGNLPLNAEAHSLHLLIPFFSFM